jgi:hypothetical protein
MKNYIFFIMCSLLALLFSSCSAIAGIFKTGVGVGVFISVLVVVLIIFFLARGKKN